MIAAIDKNAGFVQVMGESKEDCMAKLLKIGECSEDAFWFLPAVYKLVKAVNTFGGDIRILVTDGSADYP